MPNVGTGSAGNYLEEILGLQGGNRDGPDAGLWELKFSSGKGLLTLFHKSPRPDGCIYDILRKFGYIGSNGRLNFRHTIRGESSRGFKIVHEAGAIWVTHPDADTAHQSPHWTENDLLSAAGAKLRRLILVQGQAKRDAGTRWAKFENATAYEQFDLAGFMQAIAQGKVAIDFDATLTPKGTARDHGTKFRIKPADLPSLYERQTPITP